MKMKRTRNRHQYESLSRSSYTIGIRDGRRWRRNAEKPVHFLSAAAAAQQAWCRRGRSLLKARSSLRTVLSMGKRYAAGFLRAAGVRGRLVPLPLRKTAAVVLYAPGSARLMKTMLNRLRQLPIQEMIVVLHEASPRLISAARSVPGVTIAYAPNQKDADMGRALGAKLTTADMVLFVDGERPVRAETFAGFLWACGTSLDVALNDVSSRLGVFHRRESFYRLAEFLNRTLARRDLRANSLSTLPYVLSRKALNTISASELAVPPRAQTAAIFGKLRVGTGGSVIPSPPPVVHQAARWSKAARDHAEAWRAALQKRGSRLFFLDTVRKRSVLEGSP